MAVCKSLLFNHVAEGKVVSISSYFNDIVSANVASTFYDKCCWFLRMKEMWLLELKKTCAEKKKQLLYPIDDEGRVWKKSHKGRPGTEFLNWCRKQLESEGRVLSKVSGLKSNTSMLVAASIALALAPVTVKYVTQLYNKNVSVYLYVYIRFSSVFIESQSAVMKRIFLDI